MLGGTKLNETEKKYIESKIDKTKKLLSGYEENELGGEVELEIDKKGFFRVEVMIRTPHNLYRVEKISDSLMNAVDMMDEALTKQIRREREKTRDTRRRGK